MWNKLQGWNKRSVSVKLLHGAPYENQSIWQHKKTNKNKKAKCFCHLSPRWLFVVPTYLYGKIHHTTVAISSVVWALSPWTICVVKAYLSVNVENGVNTNFSSSFIDLMLDYMLETWCHIKYWNTGGMRDSAVVCIYNCYDQLALIYWC